MKTPYRSTALEALRVNVVVERARARLSQDQLAQTAGISRPTLSRIERGAASDVGISVVQRIADALGVQVSALFEPSLEGRYETDEEIAQRIARDRPERFIDADALFSAMEELHGPAIRYSRRGRPRLARTVPPEAGKADATIHAGGHPVPADTARAEDRSAR